MSLLDTEDNVIDDINIDGVVENKLLKYIKDRGQNPSSGTRIGEINMNAHIHWVIYNKAGDFIWCCGTEYNQSLVRKFLGEKCCLFSSIIRVVWRDIASQEVYTLKDFIQSY